MSYQHHLLIPGQQRFGAEAEAAQRAQQAAGTLGPDYVNRQMQEAAQFGARLEGERASQLAGEAAMFRDRAMYGQTAAASMGVSGAMPVLTGFRQPTSRQRTSTASARAAPVVYDESDGLELLARLPIMIVIGFIPGIIAEFIWCMAMFALVALGSGISGSAVESSAHNRLLLTLYAAPVAIVAIGFVLGVGAMVGCLVRSPRS
jgi:hypothetical protein